MALSAPLAYSAALALWRPALPALATALVLASTAQTTPGPPDPPFPFAARAELPASGKPVGVLIHDFDGDGRGRVIAATFDPGTLHIWSDALTPPVVIPVPDYPLGPVLLELETLDAVAIASRASEEMLVYSPTAENPAKPLHRIPLGARPEAIGAGPLLTPDQPAVVVATAARELVVIHSGGVSRTPLLDGLTTFVAVETGRVVVGSQESRSVRTYVVEDGELRANGEPIGLPGIPRDYRQVMHEGQPESWIVGGDRALWRTQGLDGGPRRVRPKRIGTVPLEIEALTSEPSSSSPFALLSLRDLSYAISRGDQIFHRGPAGQDPWSIAGGDVDADGTLDLAIANRAARRVSLVFGRESGGFHEATRVPTGRGPHSLTGVDLDSDGASEIAVINAMDQELVILRREKDSYAVAGRHPAAPAGDAVAAADVDGDGHQDLGFLLRENSGARLRVLFGDGTGQLAPRTEVPDHACGSSIGDLWLGDLDRDGRSEALVADPASGTVHLFQWTGQGMELAFSLNVPTSPTRVLVASGRIFVALASPGPRFGCVELGFDASARALAELHRIDVGLPIADLAVLHTPSDGALSGSKSGAWQLALLSKPTAGDGHGWLIAVEEGPSGWRETARMRTGLRPYALAAADLDGDGFAEVAVGAQNSHHVNLWLGRAEGLERLADLGVGRGVLDVAFLSLDAAGPPTLVAVNGFSNDLSVLWARD